MTNFIQANPYFETGDWLVIAVYLVGIILFGLWFGRDQKNARDYFLGSKNIPWWGVGFSIVATETSALTFIGVPALAYGTNLAFIQIIIGYVIARIVLAIVLVPHYFKGEIYSPYQLFSNTFGPAARRTAAGFFLIAGTLAAGVRVYVTCIPIQLMLRTDKWVQGSDGILGRSCCSWDCRSSTRMREGSRQWYGRTPFNSCSSWRAVFSR